MLACGSHPAIVFLPDCVIWALSTEQFALLELSSKFRKHLRVSETLQSFAAGDAASSSLIRVTSDDKVNERK